MQIVSVVVEYSDDKLDRTFDYLYLGEEKQIKYQKAFFHITRQFCLLLRHFFLNSTYFIRKRNQGLSLIPPENNLFP